MHRESEEKALFDALYREYLIPLKNYAYKIGIEYDEIEDMVHETFIEYYTRYNMNFDHKVKLVLLLKILRSKWIDNCRQMRRHEILHLEDPVVKEMILSLMIDGNIGGQLLEKEVVDKCVYQKALDIVWSMRKDWRDALILRVFEETSTEEACDILQIKSTVFCTRLYRAKADFKKRALEVKLFDN